MKQSLKEKILKLPVIGQAAALAVLPRKLKELQEMIQHLRQAAEEYRQAEKAADDEIRRTAEERWQATTGTFDALGGNIRDLQAQLTAAKEELQFSKGFEKLLGNGNDLSILRSRLSNHPALWGPPERLRIDPEASMEACLFNTNSGSITVGRHTFAGPGVSLIAGNHDMRLEGFPRRDLEQEDGCDIVIGEGVWLCANCTVLGPCRIGDNAVVAAGAVVIPGTEIESGFLYAGVPAKKIRRIREESDAYEVPEEAMNRFGGCLYTEGWYRAESIRISGEAAVGHWMIREEAKILCKAGERILRYYSPMEAREDRILAVSLGTWKEEIRPGATGEITIPPEAFGGREQETLKLKISGLFDPGNGDPRRLGLFIR